MSVTEKGKGFIAEFKQFIARGNVVDMAVGVIIGGAFGKISTSLVNDIIMPAISMLIGEIDFTNWKLVLKQAVIENGEELSAAVTLNFGTFFVHHTRFHHHCFCRFLYYKDIKLLSPQT